MNSSLFKFKPSFHTETYYKSCGCTVIILNSIIVTWCCSTACLNGCTCIYLTKNLHKRTQVTAHYQVALFVTQLNTQNTMYSLFLDIQNLFKDIHNSFMDIHNSFMDILKQLRISINIFRYPKRNYGYP